MKFDKHWLVRLFAKSGIVAKLGGVIVFATIVFLIIYVVSLFFLPAELRDNFTIARAYLYFFSVSDDDLLGCGERYLGPGIALSLVGQFIAVGLVVSMFSNIIDRVVESYDNGLMAFGLKNHRIIIGSAPMLHGLIAQLLEKHKDNSRIVVMTDENATEVRQAILSHIADKRQHVRIIVMRGKRDSKPDLKCIRPEKALELYMIGNDSDFDSIESVHDSLNVACLEILAEIRDEYYYPKQESLRSRFIMWRSRKSEYLKEKRLRCAVAFEYKTTYQVYQFAELSPIIKKNIDFLPFNFYETWARRVLTDQIQLAHDAITDEGSDRYVHLVVIGLSRMGEALALFAAHTMHQPNYLRRHTRITVIDKNMRNELDAFKQKCGEFFEVARWKFIDYEKPENNRSQEVNPKYEHLSKQPLIDIEWEFIQGADSAPEVRSRLEEIANEPDAIVTVAVCLNITHISLRTAMHLPWIYYDKQIPVWVQQRQTDTLVDALKIKKKSIDHNIYSNLRPFGSLKDCFILDFFDDLKYAKLINAVYAVTHNKNKEVRDRDIVEKEWEGLSTPNLWSNIYALLSFPFKLRCVGIYPDKNGKYGKLDYIFSEAQLDMLAKMEHNRWDVEKLLMGFRPVEEYMAQILNGDKYVKGVYKKQPYQIHSCITPYEKLSCGDKEYDINIVSHIPVIINGDWLK